jgi:flagellin-like protein
MVEMRRNTSVGLSPLVAVILLIAITVAAAVVVSGVFFNLAGIAGRRPTAVIDQVKLVANATTGGRWWWNTGRCIEKHGRRSYNECNPPITLYTPTGITCSPRLSPVTPTWNGN